MPNLLPTDPSPPSNVTTVQDGATSILVSWSPSNEATGYRIDYDSIGGDSDSVHISSNSTDTLNYTLMNLQNGYDYTISIIATSDHFYSEPKNIHWYVVYIILLKLALFMNYISQEYFQWFLLMT